METGHIGRIWAPQGGGHSRICTSEMRLRGSWEEGVAVSPPSGWSQKGSEGSVKCEPRALVASKLSTCPGADPLFPCAAASPSASHGSAPRLGSGTEKH